ncbi:peptide MFS transporter [Streptomyces smyrnaeus]|uniref:Peptide MFS transporter n=1 Tax=Streptomyces smyrnaeus TaxID=1387713 RepID=A0ABS3XRP5_9ACTN|nr:peptide MFS transporter [Streptomyces smyrnaeus]MBO8198071.1 peptide MFS transporter [Streptomyces smyrnaeus]
MTAEHTAEAGGTAPREQSASASLRPWPNWFRTLFMSDLWERFGFFGMQAILVLFAVAPRDEGGLGLAKADAAALFGAWIGLAFMLCLPGGWIADRVLGPRRTLLLGAAITTAGHFALATPLLWLTPIALVLLAVGMGLYKPNHQAMLNLMFKDNGRREAGISLIYVGIQVSALTSPLIAGFLGERVDWRLGFGVSGTAMLIGTIQVALARPQFQGVGDKPGRPLDAGTARRVKRRAGTVAGVLALLLGGMAAGGGLTPGSGIALVGMASIIAPVVAYTVLYRSRELRAGDRRRLRSFLWIFLGSTLFWSLIAQDGSSLTLFAKHSTDRDVLGFEVPVSWLQSATPLFILVLAPVFAWLLLKHGGGRAGVPAKFSAGLLLTGVSFLIMAVAAALASGDNKVSPLWLLVVYLMHACGELIVAAVGIAAVADVLPRRFIAHMLGLLWLFAALGGGAGSGLVRLIDVIPEALYYLLLAVLALAVGGTLALRRHTVARGLAPERDAGEAAEEAPPEDAAPATVKEGDPA